MDEAYSEDPKGANQIDMELVYRLVAAENSETDKTHGSTLAL